MIADGKVDIVFATPSYEQKVGLEYHRGMLETQHLLSSAGYVSSFMHRPGDCFVDKARSKQVTDFLQDPLAKDAQNFMFIDDDVGGWPAQKILEFIVRPDDILAGVYPRKADALDWPVELASDADTGLLVEDQGLVAALFAPTGFMRIKRHVLEHFARTAPMFKDFDLIDGKNVERSYHHVFESGRHDDGWYWGEDFTFCAQARAAGFQIWIDPNIPFSHRGTKKWEASLSDSLLTYRRKAMALHEKMQDDAKAKEAAE